MATSGDSSNGSTPPPAGGNTPPPTGDANTGASSGSKTSSGADLLGAMNKLKDGPADLKLSPATRDKYLNAIRSYRDDIQYELNLMPGIGQLGDVGQFESAIQTKANLVKDVVGSFGLEHQMELHIKYLDALLDVVTHAANHIIKSG
jgi:hypothetical protein